MWLKCHRETLPNLLASLINLKLNLDLAAKLLSKIYRGWGL